MHSHFFNNLFKEYVSSVILKGYSKIITQIQQTNLISSRQRGHYSHLTPCSDKLNNDSHLAACCLFDS